MTSDGKGRFPVGLTISTLMAFLILIGLGVWQVKRLAWKTDMLARIEALQHAPARPLASVLTKAMVGDDVEFTRVSVDCPGLAKRPFEQIYAVIDGRGGPTAWSRPAGCSTAASTPSWSTVASSATPGPARPPVTEDAAPIKVEGVLRKGDKKPAKSGAPMGARAGTPPAGAPSRVWYGRDLAALAKALHVEQARALFPDG